MIQMTRTKTEKTKQETQSPLVSTQGTRHSFEARVTYYGCSGRPPRRPCLNIARVASLIGTSPASSASRPLAPLGTPCSILKFRCKYMFCSAAEVNLRAFDVQTVIFRPSASISISSAGWSSATSMCFLGRLDMYSVTFWCADAYRLVAPRTGVSRMALPSSRIFTVPRSVTSADMSSERVPSALTTSCLNHWLPLALRSIVRPASTMRLPVADVHSRRGVSTPDAIQRCSPDLSPIFAMGSPCTVSKGGGGDGAGGGDNAPGSAGGDAGGVDGGIGGGLHSVSGMSPWPANSQLRPRWPSSHSPLPISGQVSLISFESLSSWMASRFSLKLPRSYCEGRLATTTSKQSTLT